MVTQLLFTMMSFLLLALFSTLVTADYLHRHSDGIQRKDDRHLWYGKQSIHYCALNQYLDEHEGRCMIVPGGGTAILIDTDTTCINEDWRPHPFLRNRYYVCRKTKTIIAECKNSEYFDNNLKTCTSITSVRKFSNFETSHDNYVRIRIPRCSIPGTFLVPQRNCIYFYKCIFNGIRLFRTFHKCPPSTGFDSIAKKCSPGFRCNRDSKSIVELQSISTVAYPSKPKNFPTYTVLTPSTKKSNIPVVSQSSEKSDTLESLQSILTDPPKPKNFPIYTTVAPSPINFQKPNFSLVSRGSEKSKIMETHGNNKPKVNPTIDPIVSANRISTASTVRNLNNNKITPFVSKEVKPLREPFTGSFIAVEKQTKIRSAIKDQQFTTITPKIINYADKNDRNHVSLVTTSRNNADTIIRDSAVNKLNTIGTTVSNLQHKANETRRSTTGKNFKNVYPTEPMIERSKTADSTKKRFITTPTVSTVVKFTETIESSIIESTKAPDVRISTIFVPKTKATTVLDKILLQKQLITTVEPATMLTLEESTIDNVTKPPTRKFDYKMSNIGFKDYTTYSPETKLTIARPNYGISIVTEIPHTTNKFFDYKSSDKGINVYTTDLPNTEFTVGKPKTDASIVTQIPPTISKFHDKVSNSEITEHTTNLPKTEFTIGKPKTDASIVTQIPPTTSKLHSKAINSGINEHTTNLPKTEFTIGRPKKDASIVTEIPLTTSKLHYKASNSGINEHTTNLPKTEFTIGRPKKDASIVTQIPPTTSKLHSKAINSGINEHTTNLPKTEFTIGRPKKDASIVTEIPPTTSKLHSKAINSGINEHTTNLPKTEFTIGRPKTDASIVTEIPLAISKLHFKESMSGINEHTTNLPKTEFTIGRPKKDASIVTQIPPTTSKLHSKALNSGINEHTTNLPKTEFTIGRPKTDASIVTKIPFAISKFEHKNNGFSDQTTNTPDNKLTISSPDDDTSILSKISPTTSSFDYTTSLPSSQSTTKKFDDDTSSLVGIPTSSFIDQTTNLPKNEFTTRRPNDNISASLETKIIGNKFNEHTTSSSEKKLSTDKSDKNIPNLHDNQSVTSNPDVETLGSPQSMLTTRSFNKQTTSLPVNELTINESNSDKSKSPDNYSSTISDDFKAKKTTLSSIESRVNKTESSSKVTDDSVVKASNSDALTKWSYLGKTSNSQPTTRRFSLFTTNDESVKPNKYSSTFEPLFKTFKDFSQPATKTMDYFSIKSNDFKTINYDTLPEAWNYRSSQTPLKTNLPISDYLHSTTLSDNQAEISKRDYFKSSII